MQPTILIVEDEEMLLDIVTEEMQEAGYRLIGSTTGEEAVGLLRGPDRIDLLLTDIRLPGAIDGWTIAEQARVVSTSVPVIYVTGYSNEAPRQVAGSVLLKKPYRPSAIVEAARRLGVGAEPS